MKMNDVPKTKEEAIQTNNVKYFTGKPCKNNHVDFRYTNTGICYSCKRTQNKIDRTNHLERNKKSSKKSYLNNIDKHRKSSLEWSRKNKEKSNLIKKRHKLKYAERYKEKNKLYQREQRKNPLRRLYKNTSKAIWEWLKNDKAYRRWESILGYSLETLKKHLESQFRDGMTWENYGPYWHVDHIKPQSLCSTFEEAWNINNLQPLLAKENLSKHNKYDESTRIRSV